VRLKIKTILRALIVNYVFENQKTNFKTVIRKPFTNTNFNSAKVSYGFEITYFICQKFVKQKFKGRFQRNLIEILQRAEKSFMTFNKMFFNFARLISNLKPVYFIVINIFEHVLKNFYSV
jgi:hypothetical protein